MTDDYKIIYTRKIICVPFTRVNFIVLLLSLAKELV